MIITCNWNREMIIIINNTVKVNIMYICICNAITDSMVEDQLKTVTGKTTHDQIYKACSGGETYNCGRCKPEMKKIVDTHNNKITVSNLSDEMQKAAGKNKETV